MTQSTKSNGLQYLLAALDIRPFARPATKLVLVILTRHRNSKTGLCCPSLSRLMERTGLAKRTVLLELATLKDSGIISHKKGWGNAYAKGMPNQYEVNLNRMKGMAIAGATNAPSKVAGATNEVAGATDGTFLTKQVQYTTEAGASTAPLIEKSNGEVIQNGEVDNGEPAENDEEVFDRTELEEPTGVSEEPTTSPIVQRQPDKELPVCKCGGTVAWGDPHKQTNPICLKCGKPPSTVEPMAECSECGDPCPAGQESCDRCTPDVNRRLKIGEGNPYICPSCDVLRGWSKWRDHRVPNSPPGTLRCPECDVAVIPREATPEEYRMALNGGNYVEV